MTNLSQHIQSFLFYSSLKQHSASMVRKLFSGWGGGHLTFAGVVDVREKPRVPPNLVFSSRVPPNLVFSSFFILILHPLTFSSIETKRKYKKVTTLCGMTVTSHSIQQCQCKVCTFFQEHVCSPTGHQGIFILYVQLICYMLFKYII